MSQQPNQLAHFLDPEDIIYVADDEEPEGFWDIERVEQLGEEFNVPKRPLIGEDEITFPFKRPRGGDHIQVIDLTAAEEEGEGQREEREEKEEPVSGEEPFFLIPDSDDSVPSDLLLDFDDMFRRRRQVEEGQRQQEHRDFSAPWIIFGLFDDFLGDLIGTKDMSAVYGDFMFFIKKKLIPATPHKAFWEDVLARIDTFNVTLTGTNTHAILVAQPKTQSPNENQVFDIFDANGEISDIAGMLMTKAQASKLPQVVSCRVEFPPGYHIDPAHLTNTRHRSVPPWQFYLDTFLFPRYRVRQNGAKLLMNTANPKDPRRMLEYEIDTHGRDGWFNVRGFPGFHIEVEWIEPGRVANVTEIYTLEQLNPEQLRKTNFQPSTAKDDFTHLWTIVSDPASGFSNEIPPGAEPAVYDDSGIGYYLVYSRPDLPFEIYMARLGTAFYIKNKRMMFRATRVEEMFMKLHDSMPGYTIEARHIQRAGSCAYYAIFHFLRFVVNDLDRWGEFVSAIRATQLSYFVNSNDKVYQELYEEYHIARSSAKLLSMVAADVYKTPLDIQVRYPDEEEEGIESTNVFIADEEVAYPPQFSPSTSSRAKLSDGNSIMHDFVRRWNQTQDGDMLALYMDIRKWPDPVLSMKPFLTFLRILCLHRLAKHHLGSEAIDNGENASGRDAFEVMCTHPVFYPLFDPPFTSVTITNRFAKILGQWFFSTTSVPHLLFVRVGESSWNHVLINEATWARVPSDIQDELAQEYASLVGSVEKVEAAESQFAGSGKRYLFSFNASSAPTLTVTHTKARNFINVASQKYYNPTCAEPDAKPCHPLMESGYGYHAAYYAFCTAIQFGHLPEDEFLTNGFEWVGRFNVNIATAVGWQFVLGDFVGHTIDIRDLERMVTLYLGNLPRYGINNVGQIWLHLNDYWTFGKIKPLRDDAGKITHFLWRHPSAQSTDAPTTLDLNFDISLYPEMHVVFEENEIDAEKFQIVLNSDHFGLYCTVHPNSRAAKLVGYYNVIIEFMNTANMVYSKIQTIEDEEGVLKLLPTNDDTNLPPLYYSHADKTISYRGIANVSRGNLTTTFNSFAIHSRGPAVDVNALWFDRGDPDDLYPVKETFFLNIRCAHDARQYLRLVLDEQSDRVAFGDYEVFSHLDHRRPKHDDDRFSVLWRGLLNTYLLYKDDRLRGFLIIDNKYSTPAHDILFGNEFVMNMYEKKFNEDKDSREYFYTVLFIDPDIEPNKLLIKFKSAVECDMYMREAMRALRYDLIVRVYPQWYSWMNSVYASEMEVFPYREEFEVAYLSGPYLRFFMRLFPIGLIDENDVIHPNDLQTYTELSPRVSWTFEDWGTMPSLWNFFNPFQPNAETPVLPTSTAGLFEQCRALFEYCLPFTMREADQVPICKELAKKVRHHEYKEYCMQQLIMGSGKSTVIVPFTMLYRCLLNRFRSGKEFEYRMKPSYMIVAPSEVLVKQLMRDCISTLSPFNVIAVHSLESYRRLMQTGTRVFESQVWAEQEKVPLIITTDVRAKTLFLESHKTNVIDCYFTLVDEVDTVLNPLTSTLLLQDHSGRVEVVHQEDVDLLLTPKTGLVDRFLTFWVTQARGSARGFLAEFTSKFMKRSDMSSNRTKAWLCGLATVLHMQYLSQYGFANGHVHAVPYSSFEHPAVDSKFSDPTIRFWTTICAIAHKKSFTREQVDRLFSTLKNDYKNDPTVAVPEEWTDAVRGNKGYYPPLAPNVINLITMCKRVFIPEMRYVNRVKRTNSVEMVYYMRTAAPAVRNEYPFGVVGVSGTMNPELFPYRDATKVNLDQDTTHRVNLFMANEHRYKKIEKVAHLFQTMYEPDRPVAIIDACGVLLDYFESVEDIVKTLFKTSQRRNTRVLYISAKDHELEYIYDGRTHVRFDGRLDPDLFYIYFYDQAHTVGVNIEQVYPDKQSAINLAGYVLLARNDHARLSVVSQAAFRLRHLRGIMGHQTQDVAFVTVEKEGPIVDYNYLLSKERKFVDEMQARIEHQAQAATEQLRHERYGHIEAEDPEIWYHKPDANFDAKLLAAIRDSVGVERAVVTEQERQQQLERQQEKEQDVDVAVQFAIPSSSELVVEFTIFDTVVTIHDAGSNLSRKQVRFPFLMQLFATPRKIDIYASNNEPAAIHGAVPNSTFVVDARSIHSCVEYFMSYMEMLIVENETHPNEEERGLVTHSVLNFCIATIIHAIVRNMDKALLHNVCAALSARYGQEHTFAEVRRLLDKFGAYVTSTTYDEIKRAIEGDHGDISVQQFGLSRLRPWLP